jgi:hypothetical protein
MFRTDFSLRRPSRRTALLALTAIVLAGSLVADRAASAIASSRISAHLACASGATPETHLRNFPFLPRLAVGQLGDIQAHLPLFITDEATVTTVDIDAKGVALPDGEDGPLKLQELTATFDAPFSLLPAEVDGFDLRYASARDGLLAVSTAAEVRGVTVPVTVLASISLRNAQVIFSPEEFRVFGIEQPLGALGGWFTQAVSVQELPALPNDLEYQALSVADDGLRVQIGGHDLTMENQGDTECRH